MALITSRSEFIEYCLRRLGDPVIEVNVSDEQLDDRFEDALLIYQDYHYAGTEREYLVVEIAQPDIDNGYVTLPADIIFVTKALPFGRVSNSFYPMNDPSNLLPYNGSLYGSFGGGGQVSASQANVSGSSGIDSSLTLTSYYLNRQYVDMIKDMFGGGAIQIRFNRNTMRCYFDMDWATNTEVGAFVVLWSKRIVDPVAFNNVYNDRWMKKYTTALILLQWGQNLSKFQGIALPGGVTLDSGSMIERATQEIAQLEEEIQSKYEVPPSFFMG